MGYIENLSAAERQARQAKILAKFDAEPVQESATAQQRTEAYTESVLHDTEAMRHELQSESKRKHAAYTESVAAIKTALISECYMTLYKEAAGNQIKDKPEYENIARNYINRFIESTTPSEMLRTMRTKSLMLSEMARAIDKVLEKCDPDDCDEQYAAKCEERLKIDPATKSEFFADLKDIADIEDVSQSIKLRVTDAMDQFINTNVANKGDIEDVITQIKNKTAGDVSDEIKESYQMKANAQIAAINNRDKNLFGMLIHNLSEGAMINPELGSMFVEGGKINFDKLICFVETTYTVLEMFNTSKAVNFTAEDLADIVASYKA